MHALAEFLERELFRIFSWGARARRPMVWRCGAHGRWNVAVAVPPPFTESWPILSHQRQGWTWTHRFCTDARRKRESVAMYRWRADRGEEMRITWPGGRLSIKQPQRHRLSHTAPRSVTWVWHGVDGATASFKGCQRSALLQRPLQSCFCDARNY